MAFQPAPELLNAQHPDATYFNTYLRDNAAALKAIYDSRAYLIARHNGAQTVASTGKLAFPVLLASRGGCSISGDFTTITVPTGFYMSWVRVSMPWVSDVANRITVRLGTNPGTVATRTVALNSSGNSFALSALSVWRINGSSGTIYASVGRNLASNVTTATSPMLTQIVVAQIAPYL